jgi:transposase
MGAPLEVTRTDYTAEALRGLSSRCSDGEQVRRILAIAMVLDGWDRTQAAEFNGMDRQTLRDWVHRYNALGVGGLKSRRSPGRPPALTPLQRAELLDLVIAGPDPAVHGVVRWRCVDLQAEVVRRFSKEVVLENTIARGLHELRLTRLQPRPVHPQKDPEAEETFKKTSPTWSKPRSVGPRSADPSKSGSRMKRA